MTLSYIELLLLGIFVITRCVSISAFDSLVGNPIGNGILVVGIKIYLIIKYINEQKLLH